MLIVKVHKNIYPENNGWSCLCDGESMVFSLETIQRIVDEHPEENNIRLDIHSNGGVLKEAFAIYDYLRTCGKNIYTNIEGSCHSAAVTLLLAAPYENRTANANSRAIIHKVRGEARGNVDEVESYADKMRQLQDQMIDLYADRTKLSREEAERIVNEERERSTSELLEWGFISRINPYISNYAQPTNQISMTLKEKINKHLRAIGNMLGVPTILNYEFVDGDDKVVFTTEGETADLKEGMTASPDGVHKIADGRTVTIEDGKITKIEGEVSNTVEPTPEPSNEGGEPTPEPTLPTNYEELAANLASATERIATLEEELRVERAQKEQMTNELRESHALLIEAAKGIKSTGVIGNRITVVESPKASPTVEDYKQAMREVGKK